MTRPTTEPKFRDRDTERFANGEHVRRLQGVPLRAAVKALDRLEAATQLFDLMTPRSNRFEALKADRNGPYSTRINLQWRVCFEWSDERHEPFNIEIVDYHDQSKLKPRRRTHDENSDSSGRAHRG